jgi:hypothetical protein
MPYWLEVQQMALQLAGGKPGPAAKAAALQLLKTLPHSTVIARCVSLETSLRYVWIVVLVFYFSSVFTVVSFQR